MRLREVERIARRVVPGCGAPQLSRLGAGLWHDTYRVHRGGRAFSMRLAATASRDSTQDGWLLRVMQLAADQALAPALVYGDAERGILVQEWLDGRAWPAAVVRRARAVERIADLLRRVHALPAPAPVRASSPGAWVRHYTAALGARRAADALASAAHVRLMRLDALPAVAGVLCHSDLHRLNVLECRPPHRGSALILLDWEYAHVSEPFWDLAGWSANNDFPEGPLRQLLAAYLGRKPDEADWMRCNLLVWLYDYVCLLWSELYLSSRRGGAHADGEISGVAGRAALLRDRLAASAD